MASAPSSPLSMTIAKAISANNCDAGDSVRQTASSGVYCAAKLPPPIKEFTLRVTQHPLMPAACTALKQINHALFPLERKRRAMVGSANLKIDRLCVGRTRKYGNFEAKFFSASF